MNANFTLAVMHSIPFEDTFLVAIILGKLRP
jgi:hypothetical protein